MIVYKIRRKRDGKYSSGGIWPKFSTKGKSWSQKNHITSHLNVVRNKRVYNDCEIVTFELTEKEVDSKPVSQYIEEREQQQQERELAAQRRREQEREHQQYQLFLQLKEKFEK